MLEKARGPLKIVYLSGPVDACAIYTRWRRKDREAGYFGTIYLEHFLNVCQELDAELYVITTLPDGGSITNLDWCTVHNVPLPTGPAGAAYHLQAVLWMIRLIPVILRFHPQFIVTTEMANYWFVLSLLKLFGVKMIPALHCTIRQKFEKLRASWKILEFLDNIYYRGCASKFLAASTDIQEQLSRSTAFIRRVFWNFFQPMTDRGFRI